MLALLYLGQQIESILSTIKPPIYFHEIVRKKGGNTQVIPPQSRNIHCQLLKTKMSRINFGIVRLDTF